MEDEYEQAVFLDEKDICKARPFLSAFLWKLQIL